MRDIIHCSMDLKAEGKLIKSIWKIIPYNFLNMLKLFNLFIYLISINRLNKNYEYYYLRQSRCDNR